MFIGISLRATALAVTLLSLSLSSCKATLSASVREGADIGPTRSFFVVKRLNDTHGIDLMIREKLREFDRVAECGDAAAIGPDVDVAVLYEDQWEWDMSDFLLSLTITFRDLQSDEQLASGRSVRYSLARKSPAEMTHEVLSAIFAKAGEGVPATVPPPDP